MRKLDIGALRHTLDFKRQDTQGGHDLRHSGRNHSQILSAGKHSGGIKQGRKLCHGFVFPENIVPAIEEIIIQTIERCTTAAIKTRIRSCLACADLRMVTSALTRILEEEVLILRIESLIGQILALIRECRAEMSLKSALILDRNLPYTEETEDMVDTESIEIL